MSIAKKIAAARKSKGLTRKDLANMVGLTVAEVKKYETEGNLINIEYLTKIVRALDIDENTLLDINECSVPANPVKTQSGVKLVNARMYEEDLKKKFWEVAYDPKYQWYFGSTVDSRHNFEIRDGSGLDFAVLNGNDELIGYIGYAIDSSIRLGHWFGAINFSNDRISFGIAMKRVIVEAFMKYGLYTLEWIVIRGNPIEASYDRLCERIGGRILGIKRNRALDLAGNLHDDKVYEVTREDFLSAMRNDPMVREYELAEK